MIEVGVSANGLDAVDVGKNEVRVSTSGWTATQDGPSLHRRVDAVRSGTTAGLTFPEAAISIERPDAGDWSTFDERGSPADLQGSYVLKVELPVAYRNKFYWSTEIADRLATAPRSAASPEVSD